MNNNKRKLLAEAFQRLEEASSIIETVKDEEEEYLNNIPENLQNSWIYDRAEEYVNDLNEAFEYLETIISSIYDIIER